MKQVFQGLFILCDIAEGKISSLESLEAYYGEHLQKIYPRVNMKTKLESKYRTWDRIRVNK